MKLSVPTATPAGNVLAFSGNAAGRFPMKHDLRARVEDAIERLIAMLDALDGDSDFESASDDEPALGWTYSSSGAPVLPIDLVGDDRELDEADDEDGGDMEPSLGWCDLGRGARYGEDCSDVEQEAWLA